MPCRPWSPTQQNLPFMSVARPYISLPSRLRPYISGEFGHPNVYGPSMYFNTTSICFGDQSGMRQSRHNRVGHATAPNNAKPFLAFLRSSNTISRSMAYATRRWLQFAQAWTARSSSCVRSSKSRSAFSSALLEVWRRKRTLSRCFTAWSCSSISVSRDSMVDEGLKALLVVAGNDFALRTDGFEIVEGLLVILNRDIAAIARRRVHRMRWEGRRSPGGRPCCDIPFGKKGGWF